MKFVCLCIPAPAFLAFAGILFDTLLHQMKMGAKSTTLTGLSRTGDIMLTCFVNLSRNRTVGVRLGSGENLDHILSSMNQVSENSFFACLCVSNFSGYLIIMTFLGG